MLQPLRWCCADCVIHHERDVREEQKYMCVARTSNNRVIPLEWSCWVTSNNACEPGEQLIVLANANDESDLIGWSLLLLAAMVRSFAHMPLGISDRNKMVLWPGCGGRVELSLHRKNMWSVWFVVKRRGCCCNLSGGVALIVWFTTNEMYAKNTNISVWREQARVIPLEWSCWVTSNNACEPGEQLIVCLLMPTTRVISSGDLYCCLLPRCEALRICRWGFPIATLEKHNNPAQKTRNLV